MSSIACHDVVDFLSRPESYPEDPARVELVQTHHSYLFLTDHWVYKLKKPISFDSLDFSTLHRRERFCHEELRLNRRLASRIYREVVPVTLESDGSLALHGPGPAVDWLVKMVRLSAARALPALIATGQADVPTARAIGATLARFYATSEPLAFSTELYRAHLRSNLHSSLHSMLSDPEGPGRASLEQLAWSLRNFLDHHGELFGPAGARVVDAHGDLRPEHVFLEDGPEIIDCLEFCPAYRRLDPADELCLLWLECERLHAPEIGEQILLAALHELPPPSLLAFYRSCHGLLRAKLAGWHALAPGSDTARWRNVQADYLALARRYCP